jgi:hypothetical protein
VSLENPLVKLVRDDFLEMVKTSSEFERAHQRLPVDEI